LGILPMLLLIGAWYFVMRQMQAGGAGFRQSARLTPHNSGEFSTPAVHRPLTRAMPG
jgi:ATP-dependent Zn protease